MRILLLACMTLMGLIWIDEPAKAPSPSPKTDPKQGIAKPSEPKSNPAADEKLAKKDQPGLLLKKRNADPGKADKPSEKAASKDKAKDDGLVIPNRNIGDLPEKPRTELDDKLINELGDGLASKEDDENPLLRAGNRMRQIEERLAQSDTSVTVRETQKKVVEDLDDLLKQAEDAANQQQQQQQQQQKNSSKKGQKKKKSQKLGFAQKQMKISQEQQPQAQGDSKDNQNLQSRGTAKKANTPEVKENKSVWGHLNDSVREEMEQYAKESFLPKYKEMVQKYYTSIANKSQKKSD